VATALDALAAAGSYARAARALGITTHQLLRLLQSDAEVWRACAGHPATGGHPRQSDSSSLPG
jgi:DNA-binding transcriptional LysR family regulator